MANETSVAAYRAVLRPSDRQAAVLAAHAEYAATARRWAEARPDRASVKALYRAFKTSDLFDEALSGTVAERAIAGVVDRVEIGGGRLFNAADAGRHGSKHVKVQDVAPVRRAGEVVRDACQRLRLPKTGGVEIEGDWLSMEGRAIREAWIGREGGAWLVEIVLSTRVLVRTCKVRMRATKAQRAALRALAGRVDAVWNAIGVVVWAAGVKLDGKGRATREALHAKLETKLAGQPEAVRASARAVFGEGRERPYADTRMVKGWSRDESLAVVDADHRLTQAVICEVAAQYKASQDLKLARLKDRARKKAGQRKKDAEVEGGPQACRGVREDGRGRPRPAGGAFASAEGEARSAHAEGRGLRADAAGQLARRPVPRERLRGGVPADPRAVPGVRAGAPAEDARRGVRLEHHAQDGMDPAARCHARAPMPWSGRTACTWRG